ncbi:MAG: hypothetical protein JWO38_4061 [Gemmataceae bacterium]|nr:hypothetical protein [Gemmataceae bacterium]
MSELVKWTAPVYPVATFPHASSAVIVTVNDVPDRALAGAARTKCVAAPGVTRIPDCVPVIPPADLSVAVIDRVPAVFSVAVKVWAPASAAVKA